MVNKILNPHGKKIKLDCPLALEPVTKVNPKHPVSSVEGLKPLNYYKKTEGNILEPENGQGILGQHPLGRGNKRKIRQM